MMCSMGIWCSESYRKLGSLPASPQVSGVMARVSDKTLDLECLDRIYLNTYVPNLQVGGQVVSS